MHGTRGAATCPSGQWQWWQWWWRWWWIRWNRCCHFAVRLQRLASKSKDTIIFMHTNELSGTTMFWSRRPFSPACIGCNDLVRFDRLMDHSIDWENTPILDAVWIIVSRHVASPPNCTCSSRYVHHVQRHLDICSFWKHVLQCVSLLTPFGSASRYCMYILLIRPTVRLACKGCVC